MQNRKRDKSKSPIIFKKSKNHAYSKKDNHKILTKDEEIKGEKKIENIKQNFHHFFYINWENSVFSKREGKLKKKNGLK